MIRKCHVKTFCGWSLFVKYVDISSYQVNLPTGNIKRRPTPIAAKGEISKRTPTGTRTMEIAKTTTPITTTTSHATMESAAAAKMTKLKTIMRRKGGRRISIGSTWRWDRTRKSPPLSPVVVYPIYPVIVYIVYLAIVYPVIVYPVWKWPIYKTWSHQNWRTKVMKIVCHNFFRISYLNWVNRCPLLLDTTNFVFLSYNYNPGKPSPTSSNSGNQNCN